MGQDCLNAFCFLAGPTRLSVNSRIPGALRAGVSLRFTPSRGIWIPTFPTLWKNISPKSFRKSLFWLSRQSGPMRKWVAGAWGSLSDSICRQDRESSRQWWGSVHFLLFLQVVPTPNQMVHSAFRMCLPTSLKPPKCSHRLSQSCVSLVALNPANLLMKISLQRGCFLSLFLKDS